jgi:hypothetical protein
VYSAVGVHENLLEWLYVDFVDLAESLKKNKLDQIFQNSLTNYLCQKAIKLFVCSLLSTTIQKHVAELFLLARLQGHL